MSHPLIAPSPRQAELLDRLTRKGVYLVTDGTLPRETLLARLEDALRAGVDVVQLRAKAGTARDILRVGRAVGDLCAEHDALFLVNDRVDLALALEASGVHLGQDDLPAPIARRLLGSGRLVGLSVSALDEAEAAEEDPAVDYIGFGALFPTSTKLDAEPAGPELLRQVRERIRKPIVAIGGITAERVAPVIEAGADAVAVVSAVFSAADAGAAAAELLEQVARARAAAGRR